MDRFSASRKQQYRDKEEVVVESFRVIRIYSATSSFHTKQVTQGNVPSGSEEKVTKNLEPDSS